MFNTDGSHTSGGHWDSVGTGPDDPTRVQVGHESGPATGHHVWLAATFDDGRPPVELTFDIERAWHIGDLLHKAVEAWEERREARGAELLALKEARDVNGGAQE